MKKIIGTIIVCAAVIIYAITITSDTHQSLRGGLYLTTTVTNASTSIGAATTSVISSGSALQYFYMANVGAGTINCAFGTKTAASNTGFLLNPQASSTNTELEITDQNLLQKGMNCIASATSTVSILKY